MSRWVPLPLGAFQIPLSGQHSNYNPQVPGYVGNSCSVLFKTTDAGPGWPNLVVKLNHSDRGEQLVLARFADVQQAGEALGHPAGAGPSRGSSGAVCWRPSAVAYSVATGLFTSLAALIALAG